MAEKTDRRVKYTKMVLKAGITELLYEKPIEKITVKEICERADINRGTFYSHYSDQYDLYNQVVDDLLNGIFERLGNFMEQDEKELLGSVVHCLDYIKENHSLVRVLLNNGIDYSVEKRICDIVKGIYLDEINNIPNINIEIVNATYAYIASGAIGLIKHWLNSGMKYSSEKEAAFVLKLISTGVKSFF